MNGGQGFEVAGNEGREARTGVRSGERASAARGPRRGHRLLFGTVFALAQVALIEAAACVAIPLLNPHLDEEIRRTRDIYEEQTLLVRAVLSGEGDRRIEIHPRLGWRYAPNFHDEDEQLNGAALRSSHEYDRAPPAGVLRVAAFGDSYTYGTDVSNPDAWPFLIESADAGLEVLNYGGPGYGADQAYLRYELEGLDYNPHVALLGFAPTDLARVVNVYRRFLYSRELPLFKPRFVLGADDALSLVECPLCTPGGYAALLQRPREVVRFSRHDDWFEPVIYGNALHEYSATVRLASAVAWRARRRLGGGRLIRDGVFNTDSPAFKIQGKLFEEFAALARSRNVRPLMVFLPDRPVLEARAGGRAAVYAPLLSHLKSRGIEYVDVSDAFAGAGPSEIHRWFATGGHYSPAGNRVVADCLRAEIRRRYPDR